MRQLKYRKFFESSPQVVLIFRLLAILLLLVFSRLLLYFFNTSLFPGVGFLKLLYFLWVGLRFDVVALLYANSLFILMLVLPFHFRRVKAYRLIADFVFIISNSVLLVPNLIDSIYFRFTLKRLTADIFKYVKTGSDTADMMPQFMHDFWYIFLIWIIGIFLVILIVRKIRISTRLPLQKSLSYYSTQTVLMILILALMVLGMRGGIQLKPVGILSASQYAPAQETPIVLNSAFTIMRSIDQKWLQRKSYFKDETELKTIYNVEKNYSTLDSLDINTPMLRKNVFIIIIESYSAEHIGFLNHHQGNPKYDFTPFLDSLASTSMVFDGFANGKRSIEGIPAILASLPTWITEDFITSPYAANPFNSLASLLKPEGYHTSFFHGGKNGTMGFDAFCSSAGFEHYYGKNEYPDQSDYDGNWGISDEPYFQYISKMLNSFPQPFLSTVFTLSSHHPYKVPEKFKGHLREGKLPIQKTIMYTDLALKHFFNEASKMPWFKNTIFVITADHTSEAGLPFYQNRVGQYCVPIIFYFPDKQLEGSQNITAQQVDIMPSVLDLLHYPKPFIAFGGSLFRKNEPRFGLSFLNGNFQLIQDGKAWQSDNNKSKALFDYRQDSLLQKDIILSQKSTALEMEKLLHAIVQEYNNRMIDNKLNI